MEATKPIMTIGNIQLRPNISCFLITVLLLLDHPASQASWATSPCPLAFSPPKRSLSSSVVTQQIRHQQPQSQLSWHHVDLNALNLSQEKSSLLRSRTALPMGLRNFIGRIKRKRRSDGNGDDNEEDDMDSDMVDDFEINGSVELLNGDDDDPNGLQQHATNGETWKPSMRPDLRPPVRMGENPSSKEIDVFGMDRAESVQERINRVKAGKMTDEEKQAYLRAALSSGSTPESRLPLRPPKSKAEQESMERHTKASPFPGDPIYRSIAGGKKDPVTGLLSNDLVDRVGLDMQKRKRDYLDMVTDPHRFDVYRSAISKPGKSTQPENYVEARINGEGDSENTSDETVPKPIIDPLPTDLGERLGAAANAQEVSRRQAEEEKQRMKEIERIEALNRRVGGAQQQNDVTRPPSKDGQRIQQEKLKELMKAQDDYWARKLASEREARDRQTRIDNGSKYKFMGGVPTPPRGSVTPKPSPAPKEEESPTEQDGDGENVNDASGSTAQQTASNSVPNGEKKPSGPPPMIFNPDESDILNDVSGNSPPRGRQSSSFTPSQLNDVRPSNHRSPYGAGASSAPRQRSKDNGDDDQIRRLRELNSPLPNRTPQSGIAKTIGVRPQTSPPPRFEPQRPVSASSTSGTSRSSFNNLMRNNLNDSQNPADKTKSLLNGYAAKTDSPDRANGNSIPDRENSTIPAAFNPANAKDTKPNNRMSMLFGNGQKSDTNSQPPAPRNNNNSQPPARKGPIRMQLPLGDEEEDDDDDLVAGEHMSIAEAMKHTKTSGGNTNQDERSKKWGVDMSKFM